mmetsp:Transcript_47594/g.111278  ORF Transcript_47594/g.111278 Transcript_47594/m.111278 type:complete len:234 (+) Transcript_47594:253-954(+)
MRSSMSLRSWLLWCFRFFMVLIRRWRSWSSRLYLLAKSLISGSSRSLPMNVPLLSSRILTSITSTAFLLFRAPLSMMCHKTCMSSSKSSRVFMALLSFSQILSSMPKCRQMSLTRESIGSGGGSTFFSSCGSITLFIIAAMFIMAIGFICIIGMPMAFIPMPPMPPIIGMPMGIPMPLMPGLMPGLIPMLLIPMGMPGLMPIMGIGIPELPVAGAAPGMPPGIGAPPPGIMAS